MFSCGMLLMIKLSLLEHSYLECSERGGSACGKWSDETRLPGDKKVKPYYLNQNKTYFPSFCFTFLRFCESGGEMEG